jgi:TM2 domain-containing membrane protein YozV
MTETTIPVTEVTLSEKGFVPALLLCFFLGSFGIHRFYVGKIGTGILMLLTLGGLGIWTLIDFIMIAVGSFRDKEGNLVKTS